MAYGISSPDVSGPPARAGRLPYVFPMAFVTATYLIFELGFGARLLDITGGLATHEEVLSIEKWGRFISGVALTIFVWGWLVSTAHKNSASFRKVLVTCVVIAPVTMSAAYFGLEKLIDSLVERSSGEQRRAALHLRIMTNAILESRAELDGIDLSADAVASPEGKSFLALFPAIALSTSDLEGKSKAVIRKLVSEQVSRTLGSPEQAYNRNFIPSVQSIKDSFERYTEGVREFHRALDDLSESKARNWNSYVAELKKQGWTILSVPRRYHDRVRNRVRQKGVPVRDDWQLHDQAGFYRAIEARFGEKAETDYNKAMKSAFGTVLPMNLDWTAFYSHAAVQKKWRETIGLKNVRLSPGMDVDAFSKVAYEPAFNRRVDKEIARFFLPAAEFADGGSQERAGREAIEALLVPPIALFFSMLGAFVHLFKSANYSVTGILPNLNAGLRITVLGSTVLVLMLLPMTRPNAVSDSRVFRYFEMMTDENYIPRISLGARWVVQAQPFIYPITESIRLHILGGYGFGYQPAGSDAKAAGGTGAGHGGSDASKIHRSRTR